MVRNKDDINFNYIGQFTSISANWSGGGVSYDAHSHIFMGPLVQLASRRASASDEASQPQLDAVAQLNVKRVCRRGGCADVVCVCTQRKTRADGSKNLRGRPQQQQRTERLRCNLRERISGRAVFERLEEAVSMGA